MLSAVTAWGLLALPGLLIWIAILLLPWRPWDTRESLDAESPDATADLSGITVLIPARNEQDIIGQTLDGLFAQGRGLKTILIDDQSTDGTTTIIQLAQSTDFQIIQGQPLPPGWSGKLWALEQGRRAVHTELVLLLDADIRLLPGTVPALITKLNREQYDLVSLMAKLSMENFNEKLLIPAFIFFFKLLYPFQLSNSPSKTVAAAAGGCILVKKAWLEKTGAFESLKNCLIDDCALARQIKDAGGRTWLGLSHSAVSQRPYDSLRAIWDMVARNAFTQLRYSWLLLLVCTLLMATVFILPAIVVFSGELPAMISGGISLLIMYRCYLPVLHYYHLSPFWGLLLPVTGILYLMMTWTSAWRHLFGGGARWKNRHYSVPTPR